MNYQIVPLGAHGEFILNGVRFNGKSFMYWKKNNTTNIREVIVIFDKKYENVEVRDGVMVLSLKGLNNYQDLINSVSILLQILNANQINIQLHFVVDNENHKQVAESLGRNFGVSYVVQDVNQNREQHRLENASQQLASDKAGEVAISVAKQDGGLSGGSIAGGSGDLFHNYEEPTMEGKEIQQREVESQVFYIAKNNYLLDSNGQVIEKLGNGVYGIDYDTNSITKNGKIAGSIGDYKDMGKADTYNKSNVRVLRKLPDDNKSAAFISFPVIMFVLSTLLLIGSVLLLFVLD